MSNKKVICITGIDTDIGKTIVTGLLGKYFQDKSVSVITQKISQTGCSGLSEDVLKHREIMGVDVLSVDKDGTTCPYVFHEPCSPHLAASLEGKRIEASFLHEKTKKLLNLYDLIFLEGVGGLHVPLNDEITLLDYLEKEGVPLVLVSTPRLGSINHTLSSIELAKRRGVEISCIVYNRYKEENSIIAEDSSRVFSAYLKKNGFKDRVLDIFGLDEYQMGRKMPDFDFLVK